MFQNLFNIYKEAKIIPGQDSSIKSFTQGKQAIDSEQQQQQQSANYIKIVTSAQ